MVYEFPPRFAQLKQEIASSVPDFEARVTQSWKEILQELNNVTSTIAKTGSDYIHQVNFNDLDKLSESELQTIKRKGSVLIRDIVPDEEVLKWKDTLKELSKCDPNIPGFPENDKQFFHVYWSQPQIQARSHPNMLKAQDWLNGMFHAKSGLNPEGVNLASPLSYADRFRIRHPGGYWDRHPPHVDGGSIERWEDPQYRRCFSDILGGNWRAHDAYDLDNRVAAKHSLYVSLIVRQSTVFRTYQGWLALEERYRSFPDILLSNAYYHTPPILHSYSCCRFMRIYMTLRTGISVHVSSAEFHGLVPSEKGYKGPMPTPESHPHLRLGQTMTSIPTVKPGDAIFWHCDGVHSVEPEHTGSRDSAVMYIPAVPTTPQNWEYIRRQKDAFLQGSEKDYVGAGRPDDILCEDGKAAMGF
ncbi:hypothetical protein DL96DRAFT_1667904 [Flagelloscypha sp. PMI_526]|nr:hypothetical protein DL96DRAFT_1667904 [Flagelloscypha sp. PMI_526]